MNARAALLAATLLLPAISAAEGKTKLVFLSIKPLAGFSADTAQTISGFMQSEISKLGIYDVIGSSEVQTMIGLERQKELLGCSDDAASTCMAEIANALDADRSLSGDISRVGDAFLLNVSFLDIRSNHVIARVGKKVVAAPDDLEPLFEEARITLYELVNQDPARAKEKPLAPERGFAGVMAGVRGDADVLGAGVLPGITAELSGKRFGGAITVLARNLPGVRLEGRFFPFELGRVRPFVALGSTAFNTGIAARGAVGAELRFGNLRVFGDVAFERFLNAEPDRFENSALVGLGLGWLL
ncbi:MAG: hypothetical protein ACJ790_10525 [Myxococcaceae bacterium]